MSNNIEGIIMIITAASSGMGEAAARHLAAQGASVILAARRNDRIDTLANDITRARGSVSGHRCDQSPRHGKTGCCSDGEVWANRRAD